MDGLRQVPQQERARQTYERLLDVAGELLGEVGIERISTNMICARAGMTPPALYRYFKDKYGVLEALGARLMSRQNAVLFAWLDRHSPNGWEAVSGAVEELIVANAEVNASEPGAIWTLRALRAVPQLAHVRLESHRLVSNRMTEVYAPLLPHLPRDVIWRRVRLSIEFGFSLEEMMAEEDRIPPEAAVAEAARWLRRVFED
ncbi:MAG: TetR/AcrR family transcriptional regulator [Caulobacter sp.]